MMLKKLRRDRKGGASVAVAVIMAMIVVVSLVQNIFIWGQTLSAEDRDLMNEHVVIESIYFDVSDKLVVKVRNVGSLTTHIVALWIEPVGKATVRYGRSEGIDLYLNVEEVKDIVPTDLSLNPSLIFTEEFVVKVFTERGNSVAKTYTYETAPVFDPTIGELGVFRLDWFYSKYASLQYPPVEGEPTQSAVLISKTEDYISFYIKVKNNWDRPCAVTAKSFFALTSLAPPQGAGEPNFYIVNAINYTGTPTISEAYDDSARIVVYPNQSQVFIFACHSEEGSTWRWNSGYPFGEETTTEGSGIQVSLFFEVYRLDEIGWVPTGNYCGQTISSQAIILEKK